MRVISKRHGQANLTQTKEPPLPIKQNDDWASEPTEERRGEKV